MHLKVFWSVFESADPLNYLCFLIYFQDSRNVPQHTRDKMRSLDTNIKANFIKQDKAGPGSASSTEGLMLRPAESHANSRPNTGQPSQTDNVTLARSGGSPETVDHDASPKKSRPRSRTFTFSKGDSSPLKKQKAERPKSHVSAKSTEVLSAEPSKSSTSAGANQAFAFLSKAPRPAAPEDFISYLRNVQRPDFAEVARLHKLRQLLRNETVAWVDFFITKGGMTEVVGFLYRIIALEWRSAHSSSIISHVLPANGIIERSMKILYFTRSSCA